jgi:hypothetical protein
MAPGEHILVTSIEPTLFRQDFGIPSAIRIFGPFSGDLDNNAAV